MEHQQVGTLQIVEHLEALVRKTPLDILAGVMLQYFGELSGAADGLFAVYDEFLGLLDDEGWRRHLDDLRADAADTDAVYGHAKWMGTRFQEALTQMFFESKTPLPGLTKRYGVF
jgi:hypothetical protein